MLDHIDGEKSVRHDFITIDSHDILNQYELVFLDTADGVENRTSRLWEEFLQDRGFLASDGRDPLQELFNVIQDEFARTYGEKLLVHLYRGFIVHTGTHKAMKHKEASRIFSEENVVYIDSLMESILFDYAIIFYLLGRFPNDVDIKSDGFILALYMLNECCRKGQFTDYDGSSLVIKIVNERLDDSELCLISDLYWCMLAFALCHELAHIYRHHFKKDVNADSITQEYDADSAGYDIFLKLLMKNKGHTENVISSIFQEYLYAAPMTLLLFYHCLFSTEYLLYGEKTGNTHPYPMDRITNLLDISEKPEYGFDNRDGNTVLHSYWDAMEYYISELDLKIKNHKLDDIIKKGKES